jgi:hypothetical protein
MFFLFFSEQIILFPQALQPRRKCSTHNAARQAAERFSYATNLNLVLGVSAEVRF